MKRNKTKIFTITFIVFLVIVTVNFILIYFVDVESIIVCDITKNKAAEVKNDGPSNIKLLKTISYHDRIYAIAESSDSSGAKRIFVSTHKYSYVYPGVKLEQIRLDCLKQNEVIYGTVEQPITGNTEEKSFAVYAYNGTESVQNIKITNISAQKNIFALDEIESQSFYFEVFASENMNGYNVITVTD